MSFDLGKLSGEGISCDAFVLPGESKRCARASGSSLGMDEAVSRVGPVTRRFGAMLMRRGSRRPAQ